MISRQLFTIATSDTGVITDTGPPFNGRVLQTRWVPTATDTGNNESTIAMALGQSGVVITTGQADLTAAWTRCFMQPSHDASGAPDATDTGTPASPQPIVSAGESIKVTYNRHGAVTGTLYVWVD